MNPQAKFLRDCAKRTYVPSKLDDIISSVCFVLIIFFVIGIFSVAQASTTRVNGKVVTCTKYCSGNSCTYHCY